MFVLMVGGSQNGQTMHVGDDIKTLEFEQPNLEKSRETYHRRNWQHVDAAHGYDALFVFSQVSSQELAEAVKQAMKAAVKAS